MLNKTITEYLKDILVFFCSKVYQLLYLQQVFECLLQKQLYCIRYKCEIAKYEIRYLGHLIISRQIAVNPTKTVAAAKKPECTCMKEVQQFVDLANYYNNFIQHFVEIDLPLVDLLSTKCEWYWINKYHKYFDIISLSILRDYVVFFFFLHYYSNYDLGYAFIVQLDVSDVAVEAVILQE